MEELLEGRRADGGRHALDEDALHTPIFAALSRGGWRRRQQEGAAAVSSASPVEDFRRDPLTAPLPILPAAAPEWQAAGVTGGVIVDMAAGGAPPPGAGGGPGPSAPGGAGRPGGGGAGPRGAPPPRLAGGAQVRPAGPP